MTTNCVRISNSWAPKNFFAFKRGKCDLKIEKNDFKEEELGYAHARSTHQAVGDLRDLKIISNNNQFWSNQLDIDFDTKMNNFY